MAIQTTTFKGARYVVKFHDPIEWASTESYEAIEAVQHNAFTYISKQPVPAGVQIDNEEFWLLWADPNAQMEELRQLVAGYVEDMQAIDTLVDAIDDALPIADFDSVNTVKAAIDAINDVFPITDFDSENTVKAAIDAETLARKTAVDEIKFQHSANVFVLEEENFIEQYQLDDQYIYSGITYVNGYAYALRYVNTSSNSHLIKIDLETGEVINDVDLGAYYHGNGMFVLDNVIWFTGASEFVGYTQDLEYYDRITLTQHISTFIPVNSDNYALGFVASSACIGIYRKCGSHYSCFGSKQISDVGLAGLQDGCLAYGLPCTLHGNNGNETNLEMRSLIAIRGVDGTCIYQIILPNISEELEGILFYGNSFYVVTVRGKMYRVKMPNNFENTPTLDFYKNPNPVFTMNNYRSNYYERDSDLTEENGVIQFTISNKTYKIHRNLFIKPALDLLNRYNNENLYLLFASEMCRVDGNSIGPNNEIRLRIPVYGSSLYSIYIWFIAYNQRSSNDGLYLAQLSVYDVKNNKQATQSFTQTMTDAEFETAFGTLLTNMGTESISTSQLENHCIGRLVGNVSAVPMYIVF